MFYKILKTLSTVKDIIEDIIEGIKILIALIMTSVLRKLLQLIIYLWKVHLWIQDVIFVFSYAIKILLFNRRIGIKFQIERNVLM